MTRSRITQPDRARVTHLLSTAVMTVCFATQTSAGDQVPEKVSPTVKTKIGREGVYYLRYSGERLVPKPVTERSPIVLRVVVHAARVQPDNTRAAYTTKESVLYELRFIGSQAGDYDLREFLTRADGKPLDSLPSILVAVRETLPKEHDGDLEVLPASTSLSGLPYRAIMLSCVVLWLSVTLLLVVRHLARRRPRPALIMNAAPSLAEQLQPLIEAGLTRGLDVVEQARLEMLLFSHWRKALHLDELTLDEALGRMRLHEEAGKLLRELEAWLHDRPGTHRIDVAALLAPYRAASPIRVVPLSQEATA
jgi:hypothetical protein